MTTRRLFFILSCLLITVGGSYWSAQGNSIIQSRHDLTFFNQRGYGTDTGPMTGAAFNNYQETCIYCHTPHNASPVAPLWNRELPELTEYQMYSSPNFDSKVGVGPDGVSLACLSCHDGSVAVDSVLNPPKYHAFDDSGTHYRMSLEGQSGSDSCGKCHNRSEGAYGGLSGAHDATIRYLTKNLRDDHPISIKFPTWDLDPGFNQPMIPKEDGGRMFPNGVQTFEGDKVQCASCHDPHDPDEKDMEGRDPFLRVSNKGSALCLTCHSK
ncbi:MAG TPA: cytochrome c3 family protein [Nitrospiria bacterium]